MAARSLPNAVDSFSVGVVHLMSFCFVTVVAAVRCFVWLNVFLSHSRSFKVFRNYTDEYKSVCA